MCCDTCTQFEFYYDALINAILKVHNCAKKTCNNYKIEYGNTCKCELCTNCIIFAIKQVSAYDLLEFVLCRSFSISHFINCASNKCADIECGTSKFKRLLIDGNGCHKFDNNTTINISYKYIDKYKVDNKTYKYIDHAIEPYDKFRTRFLVSLRQYIYHQFIKRNQYYNRKILFTKANNSYAFPDDWIFISIDFISNYQLKAKVITHNMSTSMGAVSHFVIHEKRIIDGIIKQSGYNFFSDVLRHGWYSAIPALNWYMIRRTKQLANDGIDLKLFKMWSDRTSKDFWCAPTHVFLTDIISTTKVPICHDTTPAGHGKTYHDQIGGTTQSHIDRSTTNGTFKLKQNTGTKSSQIVNHCRTTFSKSKTGDLDRYFIEIPASMIYTPAKGVRTIDTLDIHGTGITQYHCAYIEANRIRYRALGCCCTTCVNSCYHRQCNRHSYSGRWTKYVSIPVHKPYEQLLNDT